MLSGCASAHFGREITPQDVAWIQKNITTREEVIQRIGLPFSEAPDWSDLQFETTTTTKTSKAGELEKSESNTTVTQTRRWTKATYFYTRSEGALFSIKTTSSTFWVKYDEKGIVQNFGFSGSPGITSR